MRRSLLQILVTILHDESVHPAFAGLSASVRFEPSPLVRRCCSRSAASHARRAMVNHTAGMTTSSYKRCFTTGRIETGAIFELSSAPGVELATPSSETALDAAPGEVIADAEVADDASGPVGRCRSGRCPRRDSQRGRRGAGGERCRRDRRRRWAGGERRRRDRRRCESPLYEMAGGRATPVFLAILMGAHAVYVGQWRFDGCSADRTELGDSSFNGHTAYRAVSVACVPGISGQALSFASVEGHGLRPRPARLQIPDRGYGRRVGQSRSDRRHPQYFQKASERHRALSSCCCDKGAINSSPSSNRAKPSRSLPRRFPRLGPTSPRPTTIRRFGLYINGKEVDKVYFPGVISDGDGPLFMGNDIFERRLVGKLDNVVFDTRAMSPNENHLAYLRGTSSERHRHAQSQPQPGPRHRILIRHHPGQQRQRVVRPAPILRIPRFHSRALYRHRTSLPRRSGEWARPSQSVGSVL